MGPCVVVRDRARSFEKNLFTQKNRQNGQKIAVLKFIGKCSH